MKATRRDQAWFDSLDEALAQARAASVPTAAHAAPGRRQPPYAELAAVGVVVLSGCLLLQLAR